MINSFDRAIHVESKVRIKTEEDDHEILFSNDSDASLLNNWNFNITKINEVKNCHILHFIKIIIFNLKKINYLYFI